MARAPATAAAIDTAVVFFIAISSPTKAAASPRPPPIFWSFLCRLVAAGADEVALPTIPAVIVPTVVVVAVVVVVGVIGVADGLGLLPLGHLGRPHRLTNRLEAEL